eukprot:RCo045655
MDVPLLGHGQHNTGALVLIHPPDGALGRLGKAMAGRVLSELLRLQEQLMDQGKLRGGRRLVVQGQLSSMLAVLHPLEPLCVQLNLKVGNRFDLGNGYGLVLHVTRDEGEGRLQNSLVLLPGGRGKSNQIDIDAHRGRSRRSDHAHQHHVAVRLQGVRQQVDLVGGDGDDQRRLHVVLAVVAVNVGQRCRKRVEILQEHAHPDPPFEVDILRGEVRIRCERERHLQQRVLGSLCEVIQIGAVSQPHWLLLLPCLFEQAILRRGHSYHHGTLRGTMARKDDLSALQGCLIKLRLRGLAAVSSGLREEDPGPCQRAGPCSLPKTDLSKAGTDSKGHFRAMKQQSRKND